MSDSSTNTGLRDLAAIVVIAGAMLVVAGAFWLSVGVDGLLVAGVVSVVWSATRPVYAVGVGGVMYVTLLTNGEQFPALALASIGAVFVADAIVRWPARTAALTVFTLLAAIAAGSEASRLEPAWQAALAGLGVFAAVVYTIHRYELVRLDLVGRTES